MEFTTGNYSVVTTSEVEWKFVVEPETPLKWPIEERLYATHCVALMALMALMNHHASLMTDHSSLIAHPASLRMHDEANKGHMRKLLPVDILKRRMNVQNKQLAALGADLLIWAEVVGGRLYTGPLFVKYNGVLRGLDSPVPFLKNSMIQLCCSKDISERFMGTAKT